MTRELSQLTQRMPYEDPQAFRVLRGRRILGAADFLNHPDTPFTLLAFLMASQPIDKLFTTLFEAEAYARTEGGIADEGRRGQVGLLQSMVASDGLLYKTHRMLADTVFEIESPIYLMLRLVPVGNSSRALKGMRTARGMQLRLSAAFLMRFLLGAFWGESYSFLKILDEEGEAKKRRLTIFMDPAANQVCPKCEGGFLGKMRERLAAPPALSVDEQVRVYEDASRSIAEDPLIVSMHLVEGLHAAARQSCSRGMDKRKKLPVHLFSQQYLVRRESLHKSRMGKKYVGQVSVRKHILKNTKTEAWRIEGQGQKHKRRRTTGHDLFMRDSNQQRRDLFFVFVCKKHNTENKHNGTILVVR